MIDPLPVVVLFDSSVHFDHGSSLRFGYDIFLPSFFGLRLKGVIIKLRADSKFLFSLLSTIHPILPAYLSVCLSIYFSLWSL